MLHSRRDGRRERGQILVLFELVLIVILGFAAIVIDLGVLRNNRQILVNTFDSAALTGGSVLPVDGSVAPVGTKAAAANTMINSTIQADYPGLPDSTTAIGTRCVTGVDPLISKCGYTITYKCLIGIDTSSPPKPYISRDVPTVCNPTHAVGHTPVVASDFQGAGTTRFSACNPTAGDFCNVVVISGSATTQYALAPVVGITSGSTGIVVSASCRGPCGASPLTPVDVVLVVDRTGSMSGVDTTNATTAAKSLVSLYNPANQWLGFGLLGPSKTQGSCVSAPDGNIGTANFPADLRRWVPVGLSGTGSTFATTYTPVTNAINCYSNSGTGTDLADPVNAAAYELTHNGRTGVRKGIILETDGQPNTGVGGASTNYCNNASVAATAAKTAGITIFTIGFGLDGSNDATCPDGSGAFHNKKATYLLASMATQPSSDALGCPGTTTPNTNTDGDYFYCLPKTSGASTDLSAVFQAAGQALATGKAFLVQLYPTPVVTGVTGTPATHLGGTTVTISGEYFTGATSVMFSGVNAASFTVTSDTTITAKTPAGTAGATVNIFVTTPYGTSYIVPADQFTYN